MRAFKILERITKHPLNQQNKTQAVGRFLRWQLASRLIPGELVIRWINDSRLIVRSGDAGLTGNIYCGLHEFQDMGFLLHALRKKDLFVDIGANLGSYTVLAGAVVGARVIPIEPIPQTFVRLCDNIRINNLSENVTAFNVALGKEKGKLRFSKNLDTVNHVLINEADDIEFIEVPVRTLDSILEGTVPWLIKIDVEGFESPVLSGAHGVLESEDLCAVILELNGSGKRYGYVDSDIVKLMADYKFCPYEYDPFKRTLSEIPNKTEFRGNALFIKNIRLARSRVEQADPVNVFGRVL